jgi:4-hydroxy-3-methylbut-2-enyl diphosphate reductase
MRVIRADVMGLCFGVHDALAVIDGVASPSEVTIHGELVHNEVVLADLQSRGFRMLGESDRTGVPETPAVLITAHGVSDHERRRLGAAGKTLIDTTCPLVARVHQAATRLESLGYHVLVIGRRSHVEVRGVVEDLSSFDVIESVEEVTTYAAKRLGIVCQTTAPEALVSRVREAVARMNATAEIRFVDTVCLPTKEHQRSLERLLDRVDAVVVVGGKNSNNTRALAERCRERGTPVLHVQSAAEVEPSWFSGVACVGLTAGTSTLQSTIEEVFQKLAHVATVAEMSGSSVGDSQ